MRRDCLPFSVPLEENVSEAQANIDRKALVSAGCNGAASDHGCRAEHADRHIVNNHARHAKGLGFECATQHVRSRQDAAVRLGDAPFRRKDTFNERTIPLHPCAGKLLLDVAKLAFVVHAVVTGQQCKFTAQVPGLIPPPFRR
jgi:hypothetical protein